MTEAAESLIANRGLLLEECLPADWSFLETYRENAFNQIAWDEDGVTIRGKIPRHYMRDGLQEEMSELLHDTDRVEPAYRRLGALMMLEDNPELQAGIVTPTAKERHLKEFGDVSWYLANYITLFHFDYPKVIDAGLAAWELDRVASPRADREAVITMERTMPWFHFMGYAQELRSAADSIVDARRDGRMSQEKALIVAAGKFTLAMIHMAANRFNADYETILAGNHAKIAKRTAEGTLFDKTGGDDR